MGLMGLMGLSHRSHGSHRSHLVKAAKSRTRNEKDDTAQRPGSYGDENRIVRKLRGEVCDRLHNLTANKNGLMPMWRRKVWTDVRTLLCPEGTTGLSPGF